MNILLLGKTGLLGSEFLELLELKSREISNFNLYAPTRNDLDILNFGQVREFLAEKKIDKIIHCIAYTNVDEAEENRDECYELNVSGLDNLLKYQIPIIHFSSDYIFDAKVDDEITEDSPRNPANFYGSTKLLAEQLLENFSNKWWNIRTSWLFGKNGKNFISTIIEKSKTEEALEIVSDEIGRPTSAKDLANFVFDEFIKKEQSSGHYNIQSSGEPTSWANLAGFCLSEKDITTNIKEISSQELKRAANRPFNSVLKNTKLKNTLRDWKESVRDFLN